MKDKDVLARKFGRHLKKVREKHSISAAELARRCFIEKSHVSMMEAGESNPTLYTLHKIADALGISISELMQDF